MPYAWPKFFLLAAVLPLISAVTAAVKSEGLLTQADAVTVPQPSSAEKAPLLFQRPTARATLRGHTAEVKSIAFSPDGRMLASGSKDDTIKLWEISSCVERATLKSPDIAGCIAFSSDARTVAWGCFDGTVSLCDVRANMKLTALRGHRDMVWSVAFNAEGKMLASGSQDKTIKLWDTQTHKEVATLVLPPGEVHDRIATLPIYSVEFSGDGRVLASADGISGILLWDLATRKITRTLRGHGDLCLSVAFSPDGKTLASGSHDKTVKLWDLASGDNIATLTGSKDAVYAVAFSPDGNTLASAGREPTIRIWDVASGANIANMEGHSAWSIAFSPNGRVLATGSLDGTVTVWNMPERK